jgi:CBS domain-containing protein
MAVVQAIFSEGRCLMKIQDLMTSNVKTCRAESNLAEAATIMWEDDIGALPVVSETGKALGIITDRDIAIACGTRGLPAVAIKVSEVMSGRILACHLNEDIHAAMKIMRHEKIRRIPIVNDAGLLIGIVSLNDLVLRAEEGKGGREPRLSYEDTMNTLKAICEHRPHQTAASV